MLIQIKQIRNCPPAFFFSNLHMVMKRACRRIRAGEALSNCWRLQSIHNCIQAVKKIEFLEFRLVFELSGSKAKYLLFESSKCVNS